MLKNLENKNYLKVVKFNALMKKITLRGPNAYLKLIKILLELTEEKIEIILTLQKQL